MPPALIQIRTLWSALTIGCLMYVVIARWMSPAAAPRSAVLPDPGNPIELMCSIAALGVVAIGFAIPRLAARRAAARLGPEPSEDASMRAALPALALRYALFETAGLFGLVLVLTGRPAARILPFVGLGLAALILSFPTRDRVARLVAGSQ